MAESTKFENTLERLLVEATGSVAARPAFYRELLQSQVLVCPHGDFDDDSESASGKKTLRLAAIEVDGGTQIPFFVAEKFLPPRARYIGLPARTFFEITKGSRLVLNPGSQWGKFFTPEEVDGLLSGKLLQPEKEFQVRAGAQLVIGAPAETPPRLLEQLSRFFDTEPGVLRAWLAWYHQPENEPHPGYLLSIEVSRSVDFRELAGRTSLVLRQTGTAGHYCDIVAYAGNGFTAYFRTARPFYAKSFWLRAKGQLVG